MNRREFIRGLGGAAAGLGVGAAVSKTVINHWESPDPALQIGQYDGNNLVQPFLDAFPQRIPGGVRPRVFGYEGSTRCLIVLKDYHGNPDEGRNPTAVIASQENEHILRFMNSTMGLQDVYSEAVTPYHELAMREVSSRRDSRSAIKNNRYTSELPWAHSDWESNALFRMYTGGIINVRAGEDPRANRLVFNVLADRSMNLHDRLDAIGEAQRQREQTLVDFASQGGGIVTAVYGLDHDFLSTVRRQGEIWSFIELLSPTAYEYERIMDDAKQELKEALVRADDSRREVQETQERLRQIKRELDGLSEE